MVNWLQLAIAYLVGSSEMKKQNQKLKEDLEKKIDEHHCSCCPNHNKKESKA